MSAVRGNLEYFGVNLAGAEFGSALPGILGETYIYPTASEVDYYTSQGMNTFRLPFRWERLQRNLGGELDSGELSALDGFVSYALSKGANVILDPHNYGAYNGDPIAGVGSPVTAVDFADFWSRLATHYQNEERVIFGLMNEPPGLDGGPRPGVSTSTWLDMANSAIGAIRAVGADNLILVPGNGYDGAWRWSLDDYGGSNASIMGGVVDPSDNFAYEVHQYLDLDPLGAVSFSGTLANVDGLPIALQGLTDFAQWLRVNNARGFLGEFGVTPGSEQLMALDAVLDNIDLNSDVWLGWTAWAGGPWWDDYPFSLEPDLTGDKPQMAVLVDHIPVPEPTTWVLLLLAIAKGLLFRRTATK